MNMTPNGLHLLIAFFALAVMAWLFWLKPRWRGWLFSFVTEHVAATRAPDFIIGGKDRPYIQRWWVIPRNRLFNIYLHCVLRDDDDRALHDHPWFNLSIVMAGGYWEETPRGRHWRRPGSVVLRSPWARHRLELEKHYDHAVVGFTDGMPIFESLPAWTLFITGPKIRIWGFWCQQKDGDERFVKWSDFVDPNDPGAVGPGCDQPEVRS
ncbi:hypothetical protein [Dongia sp.]|uniref:hypothetical protein n=1 Tax=Dongia sp. TaxID=1977262 RepID=UPI0035B3D94F